MDERIRRHIEAKEAVATRVRVSVFDWLDTLWFAIGVALVASVILIALVLFFTWTASAAENRAAVVQGPVLQASSAAPGTRNIAHWRELATRDEESK